MFPTRDVYEALQRAAQDDAFKRDYDDLKRDYDDLKRDYYVDRAYFDNTHDNMTDVWPFSPCRGDERHDHPTPKPVTSVSLTLRKRCPNGAAILDPFVGFQGLQQAECAMAVAGGGGCPIPWLSCVLLE